MPVQMASAVLEIAKQRYTLKHGIYVISGSNAKPGETEFILYIENESIDEKHAVIICEDAGLVIFDLGSRVGTFVDEKRLPTLSKCNISKDVSIRLGTLDGKLFWCSTLEPQDSSGFHDDSLHLALDQTSEVNLTIPETQCFVPDQSTFSDAAKTNISHDTSIPETQDLCDPPLKTMTAQTVMPEEHIEPSQFCISSQEFNECLNASIESNSKDVLDNFNWLIDHEQEAAIKQTVNSTKQGQSTSVINDEQPSALEAASSPVIINHPQEEDELNPRTHTPDLFDVDLLEEFDKREMRMNNARANRLHNDDNCAEDSISKANSLTCDEPSSVSKAISPPGAATTSEIATDNLPTLSKDKPAEIDLFEGEQLGDERQENAVEMGSPLQHSNKENMHMGVPVPADLEPTQVFVSKKANKVATTLPSISASSSHASLVGSDLDPTQVFVPKKQKDSNKLESQLDSFKIPIPTAKTVPTDDNDLVPTQLFVPKQSLSSASKQTNFNSTMLQSDKNENAGKSIQSFFDERENDLQDDEQSSDSATVTPVKESFRDPKNDADLMMTPEFISHAFSGLKVPDTAARREFLSRPEYGSEDEDSLTCLLSGSRHRTGFDDLIKSMKRMQGSLSKKYNKEKDPLLESYMETKQLDSPKKKSFNIPTASLKNDLILEGMSSELKKSEKKDSSSTEIKKKAENNSEKLKKTEDIAGSSSIKKSEISKAKTKKDSKKEKIKSTDNSGAGSSEVLKTKRKVENKTSKQLEKTDDTKGSTSTKRSEASKAKTKIEIKPDESEKSNISISNSSSRSLRNKRNAPTEPSIDKKRLKRSSTDGKSTSSSGKPTDEDSLHIDDSKSRRERLKRRAAIDEESVNNSKSIKLSKDLLDNNDGSDVPSKAVRISGGSLKKSEQSVRTESRSQKISKSSSSGSASSTLKSSSNTIVSGDSKKEPKTAPETSKQLRTSKRLISQSSSTLSDKDVSKKKELLKRVTRSRNPSIDTNSLSNETMSHHSSKHIKSREEKAGSIQKQQVLSQSKDVEHNSSIIPVQAQRRSSRRISVNSGLSQEVQLKNIKTDEQPTTSRAAARSVSSGEFKSGSKPALKIAFTMVDPQKQEELLKNSKNKWEITTDLKDCEVLVMDAGNRTLKFLIAVAKGIPIVTTKWLQAIEETGTISVRSNYFFKDTGFERSFKFSLLHTLNEAKRAKLFTNFQFLLTTSIVPTPGDMKAIITCAGGTILDKDHMPEEAENQELYLISSKKDRQHWHSYRRKNANLCITSTEAVMLAVMRYDSKILRKQSF